MTFSAAAADERVLDVTVGDDAVSVSLRGRAALQRRVRVRCDSGLQPLRAR
jgi:hypothetical protein